MFTYLLTIHSWFRWLVVINLILIFIYSWFGKNKKKTFTYNDYKWVKITNIILGIQFLIGIVLFTESTIAQSFWQQLPHSLSLRQIRFFGLEHPFMMILGIILSNYFTYKAQFKINTTQGCSYVYLWYLTLILIIFSSIPWAFSPLTSRPNFRFF